MDRSRVKIYDHEEQEKDIQDSALENAKRYARFVIYLSRGPKKRLKIEFEKKKRAVEIWFEEHELELYQLNDGEWSYRKSMRIFIRIDLKTYSIVEWVHASSILYDHFEKKIISLRPKQKNGEVFLILTLDQKELSEADKETFARLEKENIITSEWGQCKS